MTPQRPVGRIRMPGAIPPTLVAGLILPVVLAACGSAAGDPVPVEERPTPVRTAPVESRVLSRSIMAAGTLGPKEEVALSFKVGGIVSEILVDAGDQVPEGQALASLDLTEIEAGLTRARAAAAKAERDLERARRLHADSVVSRAQLEDAWTAAEVARADLETARFNRRFAEIRAPAGGSILRRLAEPGETVEPGTAILVLGSRARGSVLRLGLADRDVVRIRPGDEAVVGFDAFPQRTYRGRVTEIGTAAQPGTGTYAVEVTLASTGIHDEADGSTPPGEGSASSASSTAGRPPRADTPDHLPAGLIARVEILPRAGAAETTVPVEALLEADGREATVFVISDEGGLVGGGRSGAEGGSLSTEDPALSPEGASGEQLPVLTARRRRIVISQIEGDVVAVADGLEGVDAVVTEGAAWLSDGERVRVLP